MVTINAGHKPMVTIYPGHSVCNGYNNCWPFSLQYISTTQSPIDVVDSGQSVYNGSLVSSGHLVYDGDCPMSGCSVGNWTSASIGWLVHSGLFVKSAGRSTTGLIH